MADYTASGSATGTATATGAIVLAVSAALALEGSAAIAGTLSRSMISSGSFSGTSEAAWNSRTAAAGAASGTATATGAAHVVKPAAGVAQGTSAMGLIEPLPLDGTSTFVTAPVVDRVVRASVADPATFSWCQLLQRGDLPVYFCNKTGGRAGPVYVAYNIYQVRSDESRQLIGATNREPVQGGQVGEFYATGLAGEQGQPGNFVIVWSYRKTASDDLETIEMTYVVQDAVLADNPADLLVREEKYGWD